MMTMELFSTQEAFELARTKMSLVPLTDDGAAAATAAGAQPGAWIALATFTLVAIVIVSMVRLSLQLEFKVHVRARKAAAVVDVNDLSTYSSPQRLARIVQRFGRQQQQESASSSSRPKRKRLTWHSSVRDYTQRRPNNSHL